jgi:sortase A
MWKYTKSADGHFAMISRENRASQRSWNMWRWIERSLLMCGLGLLAIVGIARLERSWTSQEILRSFNQLGVSASTSSGDGDTSVDAAAAAVVPSSHTVLPAVNKEITQTAGGAIAVLRIPKIHLEVPVLNGTDALTLNHAVGRIIGTAKPGQRGNIGIAGHRDGFFRKLGSLEVGDAIELQTTAGIETYEVDAIQIVTPDNIGVLQPRHVASLTLVTCYPFHFVGSAPQRYIVTASLVRGATNGPGHSTLRPAPQPQQYNKEKA